MEFLFLKDASARPSYTLPLSACAALVPLRVSYNREGVRVKWDERPDIRE